MNKEEGAPEDPSGVHEETPRSRADPFSPAASIKHPVGGSISASHVLEQDQYASSFEAKIPAELIYSKEYPEVFRPMDSRSDQSNKAERGAHSTRERTLSLYALHRPDMLL